MSEEFTRSYYHQPSDADNYDLRHRTTAEQMFDPDSYLSFSEFFNGSYDHIHDQNLFPSAEGLSVVRGEEVTPNSSISSASENDENSNKGKKNLHELNQSFKQDDREKIKRKPERQARYAFMTKSEVDHLEDGYRWRKYGQKAVKNNAYPRSYYRCTTQKCGVKKRVERSFEDPSVVVTTYEGQHNHRIPVALRGHVATTSGMFGPAACSSEGFSQELLLAQMQQPYGGDADNRYPDDGLLQDIIPPPPPVFPKLQDHI